MSFFKSKEKEPTVQTNPLAVKPAEVNTLPKPNGQPGGMGGGGMTRRRKTRRKTRRKKSRKH